MSDRHLTASSLATYAVGVGADFMAHGGLTILSAVALIWGMGCQGAQLWINWDKRRDERARAARVRPTLRVVPGPVRCDPE